MDAAGVYAGLPYDLPAHQSVRWAQRPEYTSSLLRLVQALPRPDREAVFAIHSKPRERPELLREITAWLFEPVYTRDGSVKRRVNQLASQYYSHVQALKNADPYQFQDILDAIKSLNPHWDELRALLADHPEYPRWSLAEAEAELEQARERDGPLGTQAMQDVSFAHRHMGAQPAASGSGSGSRATATSSSLGGAHPPANSSSSTSTSANAVAGPSTSRSTPNLNPNPPASGSGSGTDRKRARFSMPEPSGSADPHLRDRDASSGDVRAAKAPRTSDASSATGGRADPPVASGSGSSGGGGSGSSNRHAAPSGAQRQASGSGSGGRRARYEPDDLHRRGWRGRDADGYSDDDDDEEEEAWLTMAESGGWSRGRYRDEDAEDANWDAVVGYDHHMRRRDEQEANRLDRQEAIARAGQRLGPRPQAERNAAAPAAAAAPAPAAAAAREPSPLLLSTCPKCSLPLDALSPALSEAHLRSCLDGEGAALSECPVCEMKFRGTETSKERERHVDACCQGLGAGGGGAAGGEGGAAAAAATQGVRWTPGGPSQKKGAQKREHVVFVSDSKTVPKDEHTGEALECIMCLDEFAVEQRLARLSCYCLYHEECIVSYWRNPSKFCPTHRDLDTTPEVQMRTF